MSKHFRVNITCNKTGCKVRPGKEPPARISKKSGIQIEWHAAKTAATVRFPTSELFGWASRTIRRGRPTLSGRVKGRTETTYEYTVFCHHCKKSRKVVYAVGGSNPRIIIDP